MSGLRKVARHSIDVDVFWGLMETSLVPATLMIASKLISIFVLVSMGEVSFDVYSSSNFFFPFKLVFSSEQDRNFVLSYSNFFMFLTVFAGSLVVSLKNSLVVHSKYSQSLVLKLAKFDLLDFINSSFISYKQLFVWGVFLLITTIYLVISSLNGDTYPWIAYISLVVCLLFLWVSMRNVQMDILFYKKYIR